MSNVLNIEVYQGATFKKIIRIMDSNTERNLTGYTARGQIRKFYTDTAIVATFTLTIKDQVTNTGEIEWLLAADDTSAYKWKEEVYYVYDIELVSPTLEIERILQGTAKMLPEVTK